MEDDDQPTGTDGDENTTPATDPAATDGTADVEKWKALARKHEQQAKANADKAKRFDALEESQKSELQKATDKVTAAEASSAQKDARIAALEAAIEHKLNKADLDLVGSHGTPEEIAERVANLATRLGTSQPTAAPADAQGPNGGPVNDDKGGMSAEDIVTAVLK